ncbi:MAG: ABC transporter ATP-binding protein [Variibacter sp.]|nr:ABC transporter ATP-binding protein [Variibacter sp.]
MVSRPRTPAAFAARLTFEHVSHRYGEVEAVNDVSLDIAPGEILCLLGPSGCGKTTLLRLAAGVETPTAGRILINGQDVTKGPTMLPPERRGVGLMFQDFALFPHLTNLANVMFGLRDLPRPDAEREARLALERVGLGDLADAYPHMLSGGEQQRVALARAVAPRPNVLLMDEPFSGLDRRLREEVREDTLAVLRESRVTCIVVTHDPEEALQMGDRIALMRAGGLVQVDEPEAIYHRPVDIFAARYFSMLNEVLATVRDARVHTPLGAFAAPGLAEGSEAIVGIRPHGILLRPSGSGVPGRLESRRFLGDVELLDIRVEGLETPLRARSHERTRMPLGSEVGIAIDPSEVLVFAAPGA